jgi:hypothetical protein
MIDIFIILMLKDRQQSLQLELDSMLKLLLNFSTNR